MPPMSPVEVPVRHLREVVCCDAIWAAVVGPTDASTCHTGNGAREGCCGFSNLVIRLLGDLELDLVERVWRESWRETRTR